MTCRPAAARAAAAAPAKLRLKLAVPGRGGGEGEFRVKSFGFRVLGLGVGDGLVASLKGPRTQQLGPFNRIYGDITGYRVSTVYRDYTGMLISGYGATVPYVPCNILTVNPKWLRKSF